jgi:uncharacterized protein (DUF1778 family)
MATTDRTSPPRKDEYLQARVSREDKEQIEMAARLAGLDVSVYIRLHVLKAAKRDLENQAQESHVLLSGKEWDQFMKIMEAPPQLNENLRRAFRDFQKKYG